VKLNSVSSLLINVGQSGKTTCQGDSGGPTFMNIGGQEQVIGVTSYGLVGCTSGGTMTRVDAFKNWVAQYVTPTNPPPNPNPPPTPDPPPTGCGVEQEPNNVANEADSVCSDGKGSGSIGSASDVDWFAWSIGASSTYYVNLAGAGKSMTLYKAINGSLYTIGSSSTQVARYTTDGGTYYLRVSGSTGAYNIDVDVTQ
jgi:hypothetical protein